MNTLESTNAILCVFVCNLEPSQQMQTLSNPLESFKKSALGLAIGARIGSRGEIGVAEARGEGS